MGGLLEVATVVMNGDPRGREFDAPGCALSSEVADDVCSPTRTALTGEADSDGSGQMGNLFTVITRLKSRARCSPGTEEDWVSGALDMESEKAAGVALFGGPGSNPTVSLAGPDVATVASGASTNATVAALLVEFWGRATGVHHQDTVVHLGIQRLLEMFGEIDEAVLKNLDIKVATSPGYPATAIAVTGPIRIEFGPDEVIQQHDWTTNDKFTEANRLGVIEFDPCFAVRVA